MVKRILVLDDDVSVLETIEMVLKYEGYEAFTIGHTYNIFKTLADYNPQLLLIDFALGGLTGAELCKLMKDNPETREIFVIIISAYPQSEIDLKDCGCDHFIAKPFSLEDLYGGINMALEKKSPKANLKLKL